MDDRRRRETFGELLRRHRAAGGLSQEALAVRAGLSREAISMLERGVRLAPRTSTVAILADALRLKPADRETLAAAARPAPEREPAIPGPAAARVPRELPRPPADFTGRAGELARLGELLGGGGAVALSAVDGMAGVGKSALAIRAAHLLVEAGAFP